MQHMSVKNTIVLLLAVLIFAILMAGCNEEIPDTTSEEAGLYLYGYSIVGADGKEVTENGDAKYELASNGDIITVAEKKIVVAAYNVKEFTYISEASISDEESLSAKVPVIMLGSDQIAYEPVTWTLKITVNDCDAVNKQITVKSTDTASVYFGNGEESITVEADSLGETDIEISACYYGEFRLVMYNCFDEPIGAFTLKLDPVNETDSAKIAEVENQVENCKHDFEDREIKDVSNSNSKIHICTKCGLITDSELDETEECEHHYVTKVIAPTKTSRGYTLHTCTLCGDSYMDNYKSKLTNSSTTQNTTTPKPTATAKPTATPKPSDTIKPTATPEPVETLEPMPKPEEETTPPPTPEVEAETD